MNFRILTTLLVCLFSLSTAAQTVFDTETFGTGAAQGTVANGFVGDMGTWTTANTGVNNASANEWYVSGEECGMAPGNCGTACSGGNNTLHVSAIGGLCGAADCGAAYDATFAANITNKRAISPIIDCSTYSGIELNFHYIAAQQDDGFFAEYSLDGGTNWTTFTGGNVAESQCCCLLPGFCGGPDPITCAHIFSGQGYWATANLALPAGADGNPQVRVAFHWSNDGNGVGTDPSVAIDSITLTHDFVLSTDFVELTASASDNINRIIWKTANEMDNDFFVIEHSTDGKSYQEIGRIKSAPNKSQLTDYAYLHEVSESNNYYRIKSVDIYGKEQFSRAVFVKNDLNNIYLSRQNDVYTIKGLDNLKGEIQIYDLSGQAISNILYFGLNQSEVVIPTSVLKEGIYIISIRTDRENKNFKIAL